MAKIDVDRLWRGLGSFYGMFPVDDRAPIYAFWNAYADLIADLWTVEFQYDQARNLFEATPFIDRQNLLLNLSQERRLPSTTFDLVSVLSRADGITTVRGSIRKANRTVRAADIPRRGLLRIGSDTVPYISSSISAVISGSQAGYADDATFIVEGDLPHDHRDTVDLNEPFRFLPETLVFRVSQEPGATFVDATSNGRALALQPQGLLELGSGVTRELVPYTALTVAGDRYVFTLSPTFNDNQIGPSVLLNPRLSGESFSVKMLDASRWAMAPQGPIRMHCDGAAVFTFNNQPSTENVSSSMTLVPIVDDTDFDLGVGVTLRSWTEPDSDERRAGLRLAIDGALFDVGVRQAAGGNLEVYASKSGVDLGSLALQDADTVFDLRAIRTGNTLELLVQQDPDADPRLIASVQAGASHAKLSLFGSDEDTGTPAVVVFDEITRRAGQAVGSTRDVSTFTVDDLFPWQYAVDEQVVSSNELRDWPRPRRQSMVTTSDITADGTTIEAMGATDGFLGVGVPPAGVLTVNGVDVVYDSYIRTGPLFRFSVRTPLPPEAVQLAGASILAADRVLTGETFTFPVPGQLHLRDRPTRLQMWAPEAQEDQQHIQKLWGRFIELDAAVSSDAYLRKVQGSWFARMMGPTADSVHIAIHTAMGLPCARAAGVVTSIDTNRDALGNILDQSMVIQSPTGSFRHFLPAGITGIDWLFEPGQIVRFMEPLTNGVELIDHDMDPNWPERFGRDPKSPDKFTAFGVMIDISAISADADVDSAIRQALRVKANWSKMFVNLLLTTGDELVDPKDEVELFQTVTAVDDIAFDEGQHLIDPQSPIFLDDGHKLDQGKHLDSHSIFNHFPRLNLGLNLDSSMTLDMDPRAFDGAPDGDNHASEQLELESITEIEVDL